MLCLFHHSQTAEASLTEPRTLNELYLQGIESQPDRVAFRSKSGGAYRDVSAEEFGRAGREIALGLVSSGLEMGDRIGILSETRLEWPMVDMGILTAGSISVPIYPSLTEHVVRYIVEDSGARAVFAADPEQAAKLEALRRDDPQLLLVVFDRPEEVEGALSLDQLRERGRSLGRAEPELYGRRAARPEPDDLATIIYTSGTTGPPKGVMLSHRNIVSNVEAGLQVFDLRGTDTSLSFLPLSHILERMGGLYCMFEAGVTIAYAESFDTVAQNLLEARPTVAVSVPRLYEKIYGRVLDNATRSGFLKKQIFFWAHGIGVERSRRVLAGSPVGAWLGLRFGLADHLVFSKLRERTGGRLRFFISGGAPLAREIAEFFHAAGLPILEGYGLTESSPVLAVNTFENLRLGTVGKPLPNVEIRIADDGEILARGPNIMLGYYNLPEATAEALADGWLHTGDIGHLDEDGFLVITDRKKDLIVTAGGKNVAPQPIENALKTDKYITEAVVLGDRRPYLTAIIVPNFERLDRYVRYKGIRVEDRTVMTRNPQVRDLIRRRIARHQRDAASYETIKRFHLLDRDLTVEGGELTPTLKVKRKEISERFREEIEALYAGNDEAPKER
jgi:long-chain acyl-CoA synthetase